METYRTNPPTIPGRTDTDIACPHCEQVIHLVILREDVPAGRRLLFGTQDDHDQLRAGRGW